MRINGQALEGERPSKKMKTSSGVLRSLVDEPVDSGKMSEIMRNMKIMWELLGE